MKFRHLIVLIASLLLASGALAEVREKTVNLPGKLGKAVLYTPAKIQDKTAAVIVIHEWWGLNEYARDRARQLAEEGYLALALDMYGHGKVAEHPEDAQAFMQAALSEPDKMNARFDAARKILEKQKTVDTSRIFAIGYCFGGAVVLNQARRGVDIAGVASFHGSLGTEQAAQAGTVKARVLVAHGADDPMVPPEQVVNFVSEMLQADVDLRLLSFPGVLHSFTNPEATEKGKKLGMPIAYDAHADKTSWRALLQMIGE